MACVIVAADCLTPLGMSLESTWLELVRGTSGVGQLTRFDQTKEVWRGVSGIRLVAQLPCDLDTLPQYTLDRSKWSEPGFVAANILVERIVQSVEHANSSLKGSRVALIGATAMGGQSSLVNTSIRARADARLILNQCQNVAGAGLATRLGICGPSFSVEAACASATHAILIATSMLESNMIDAALVHAHEFPIHAVGVGQFSWIGALYKAMPDLPLTAERVSRPFSVNRRGFILAEGAGAVLLAREDFVVKRRLPSLALILGGASVSDCEHATRTSRASVAQCMREALAASSIGTDSVGMVSAHATSTPSGDEAEAFAVHEVFQDQAPPPVTAHKGQLGHALGASGVLQAAVATAILRTNVVPPTPSFERDPFLPDLNIANSATTLTTGTLMLNAFGFGGTNATLIVARV